MAQTKNIYTLPVKKKDLITTISDPRAHFGHLRHAIDFVLPKGSIIYASKAGIVIDVKVNSKKGGLDPKYSAIKYLNYLTIQHSNGELSQYAHLKYKGALIKVGDKVKQGQPIALSGNTGFTTTPHLHFHVYKYNKTNIGWETLKVRFKERVSINRPQEPVPKHLRKTLRELEKIKKKMK